MQRLLLILMLLAHARVFAQYNESYQPVELCSLYLPPVLAIPVCGERIQTGRDQALHDTMLQARYGYHWLLFYDFHTTFTGFHYTNARKETDLNNLFFYYNIDLKNSLEFRKLKWELFLFNDYGCRYFFDSITTKTQDQFTMKNSLSYPVYQSNVLLTLSANVQSKLWNTYQYRQTISGEQERYLYDGYMSPGTVLYAGGVTYRHRSNASLQVGLGSSKVVHIRKQAIFESRGESTIEGLKKGERKKSEFGYSLTLSVPMQKFGKIFHWEFIGNAFTPAKHATDIKYYTFEINTVFHAVLLNYVRVSLRTRCTHNYETSIKPLLQNQVTLGFYLNNQL